jgi:hypothetical protein
VPWKAPAHGIFPTLPISLSQGKFLKGLQRQEHGSAPCLGDASAGNELRFSIGDFADASKAVIAQVTDEGQEEGAGTRRIPVYPEVGRHERSGQPGPDGSLVVAFRGSSYRRRRMSLSAKNGPTASPRPGSRYRDALKKAVVCAWFAAHAGFGSAIHSNHAGPIRPFS